MTLQLCVSRCAHAAVVRRPPSVVRGSPDPAHATTEGLPRDSIRCADHPRSADDLPRSDAPPDFPDDDGDWEEFDPTQLESWILDDFDWDVEESYPERGDYWDDSLDREWDLARAWRNIRIQSHLLARRDRGLTPPRSPAGSASRFYVPRGRASQAVCSQAEPGNKDAEP